MKTIFEIAEECGAVIDSGEPADRHGPSSPPTFTFTDRELETFAARIAPQATPAAVDDATVDRFWDEYIRQGQGGGALMYRDVKRLLTAALAAPPAEVKP